MGANPQPFPGVREHAPEPDPGKTFITTDNLGQYALTRETLAAALSNVPDAVPGSLDGTVEKLEALVGALKTLA